MVARAYARGNDQDPGRNVGQHVSVRILVCSRDLVLSERLKTVPDLLETLMSEKRLLQASILLVRSLKIINKSDIMEIGAVSDLRSYLIGQETVSPFSISQSSL